MRSTVERPNHEQHVWVLRMPTEVTFLTSEPECEALGAFLADRIYEFNTKSTQKDIKKKYRLIPCPTFNSKEGFWN